MVRNETVRDEMGWDAFGWDEIAPANYIPACRQAGARMGTSVGAQAELGDIDHTALP